MKRISVLLVLSGIVFSIIVWFTKHGSNNSSQSFSNYIPKKKETLTTKSLKKSQVNTVDISRAIANRVEKPNLDSLPKRYPKLGTVKKGAALDTSKYLPDFQEGDDPIRRIDDLYAIPREDFVEGSYELVEKRSSFYIVKSEFALGDGSLAVVGVKGSKYLGIATGVVKVELFNFSQKDSILIGYDYEIQEEYQHLNRVFYKFDTLEEARLAYASLKGKVQSAQLEILQFERSER